MIAILGKGFISCLVSSNNRNLQLLSCQKIYSLLGVLWNVWPWSSDYARLSFGVHWYLNQPCLQGRRIHDMLTLISVTSTYNTPVYIKNLLNQRDTSYNQRGQHLVNVPRVNTTNYGLHSFRYSACKPWNSLPNSFRTAPTTSAFKLAVNEIKFNRDCCSFYNLA